VSGDDGYYYVKFSFFDTSGDAIYFGGAWGASSDHAFVRFTSVNIPQGATITTAYIIFESQYGSSGTVCNVNIYFENADSPAAPVDWADMNGRSKTAAVAWNNVGDWTASSYYNSPELSSILQTVVDRPGFGETVVIAYIYDNGSSDSADRNARSIEPVLAGGSGKAPGLYVEWTS
jgi:hypothetical protein